MSAAEPSVRRSASVSPLADWRATVSAPSSAFSSAAVPVRTILPSCSTAIEEISERDAAIFAAVVHADEYPRLKVALDAGVMRSDSDPFAFGVATQLDGVQAVMDARAAAPDQQADAVATASEPIDALDPRIAADKRYRAADRSVREAEKALHGALRARRQALREAQERISTAT